MVGRKLRKLTLPLAQLLIVEIRRELGIGVKGLRHIWNVITELILYVLTVIVSI